MDKEQFFAALAADIKEVKVEALNAVFRFRVLTGRARDAFHEAVSKGDKTLSHFEAAIVAATVVDDEGNALCSAEDVDALRDRNGAALSAVAKVAMQVNNLGADAEATAAKN